MNIDIYRITRWKKSQIAEKQWWLKWKKRTDYNQSKQDSINKASEIKTIISSLIPKNEGIKILQIGPGADGEINFLEGKRFAIDPLAEFFKNNFPEYIDPDVDFIMGMAETLPYPDLHFDLIFILNALDHCADPKKVLNEISRCLKKNGILIIEINAYSFISSILHNIFNFIDPEHPNAISKKFITLQLQKRFCIISHAYYPINSLKKYGFLIMQYNPVKAVILHLLQYLRIAPSFFKIIAIKK